MIIGLTGYKGSGKDTVGQYLVDAYGYERIAFADKLKQAVAALFNVSLDAADEWKNEPVYIRVFSTVLGEESGMTYETPIVSQSWRSVLQRMGTEVGREVFGYNFWVDLALPLYPYPLSTYRIRNYVVTDVRFDNEASRILELGGKLVFVDRPGCEPDGHASEDLPLNHVTHTIRNDSTIEDLRDTVDRMMA